MAGENQAQENQGITLDQLKQVLGEFKQEMNDSLTSAIVKQKKAVDGRFETFTQGIGEQIKQQLTTVLDEVIPGSDDSQPPEQPAGEQQPANDDPIAKLQAMLQAQTQQMEAKLSETTQQYEQRIQAMQDAVEQERLNTAKVQARNQLLDPLRSQLHNPDSFWSDLERLGATYDAEKGGYGVAGKDEFDNPTWAPLNDRMGDFQKQLAYQFKPRPGAGTGTQPGQSPPTSSSTGTGIYSNGNSEQVRVDTVKKAADPFAAIAQNIASASVN